MPLDILLNSLYCDTICLVNETYVQKAIKVYVLQWQLELRQVMF